MRRRRAVTETASTGRVLAEVGLNKSDLLELQGTPLPQDAALDELRLKDVPTGTEIKPGQRLDPLLHYAGRANVKFTTGPKSTKLSDLQSLINRERKTVTSSTGELKLDYGEGLLTINALTAAHSVLVPLQCEYYALEGIGRLLSIVKLVRQKLNPALAIEGVLLTMYDGRTLLTRRVE